MPSKRSATKRKATFTREKRAKAVARQRVGSPKPARALDERSVRRDPKHKQSWETLDE